MEKTKEEIDKLLKKFIKGYEKTVFKIFKSNWDFFTEVYLEAAHFWSAVSFSVEPGNWKWKDVEWSEGEDISRVLRFTTIYKINICTYQHYGAFGYLNKDTKSLYLRSPDEQLLLILRFYESQRTY